MWIIETKGWEDKDVPHKDERTVEWCKWVAELTGQQLRYIKVPYSIFTSSRYKTFRELVDTIKAIEEKDLI